MPAWTVLKEVSEYGEAWLRHSVAAGVSAAPESGPFRIRFQTEADLEAERFEMLAWEDRRRVDGPASPFWRQNGMPEACWSRVQSRWSGSDRRARLGRGAAPARRRSGAQDRMWRRGGSGSSRERGAVRRRRRHFDQARVRAQNTAVGAPQPPSRPPELAVSHNNVWANERPFAHSCTRVPAVNGREFITRVRKLARRNGIAVRFDRTRGMGSHRTLYYGDRFTVLKDRRKPLKAGKLRIHQGSIR